MFYLLTYLHCLIFKCYADIGIFVLYSLAFCINYNLARCYYAKHIYYISVVYLFIAGSIGISVRCWAWNVSGSRRRDYEF